MIFLTVGTQFPFDRLVRAIDELVDQSLLDDKIYAQIGMSSYKPRNFEAVLSLENHVFAKCMREASCIISHAGMGTIAMALENRKPLLVMPRLKKYGEVVNDHQVDIVRKFEQLGYLLAAYRVEELLEKINALESFVPRKRETNIEAVLEQISKFLNVLCNT
jgi:UDP-N-acetylglucosamine transferase subunit ALG13